MTEAPTFTRGERCPQCGQPLMLGVCGFCGPVRAPVPAPVPTGDRAQTLQAIGLALLVILVLASGFLIVRVTSLDSDLKEERTARADAENRITTLEGSLNGVQDDAQSLHSQLDALAAADPTAIATRVQPSVYTVETPGGSFGSAWVAFSDHITAKFVTNYHVIADAWESGEPVVSVYQDEGRVLEGTIELALPDIDLALVAVQADIPALTASDETPRAGEAVLVVGSPFGLGGSVTTGAVSAVRPLNGLNYIQFSAPISPGSSGGPLVNPLGEVIGITEAKAVAFGAEGIGIAIPVNQVCLQLNVC